MLQAVLDRLRGSTRHPGLARRPAGDVHRRGLAGLLNALKLVGKELSQNARHRACSGWARPTSRSYRLLTVDRVLRTSGYHCRLRQQAGHLCTRGGSDIEARQADFFDKWQVCCRDSNPEAGLSRRCRDRLLQRC